MSKIFEEDIELKSIALETVKNTPVDVSGPGFVPRARFVPKPFGLDSCAQVASAPARGAAAARQLHHVKRGRVGVARKARSVSVVQASSVIAKA